MVQELQNKKIVMPKSAYGCFWEWSIMRAFEYFIQSVFMTAFHNEGLICQGWHHEEL